MSIKCGPPFFCLILDLLRLHRLKINKLRKMLKKYPVSLYCESYGSVQGRDHKETDDKANKPPATATIHVSVETCEIVIAQKYLVTIFLPLCHPRYIKQNHELSSTENNIFYPIRKSKIIRSEYQLSKVLHDFFMIMMGIL